MCIAELPDQKLLECELKNEETLGSSTNTETNLSATDCLCNELLHASGGKTLQAAELGKLCLAFGLSIWMKRSTLTPETAYVESLRFFGAMRMIYLHLKGIVIPF